MGASRIRLPVRHDSRVTASDSSRRSGAEFMGAEEQEAEGLEVEGPGEEGPQGLVGGSNILFSLLELELEQTGGDPAAEAEAASDSARVAFWLGLVGESEGTMESNIGHWPSFNPHNFCQFRPTDPPNPSHTVTLSYFPPDNLTPPQEIGTERTSILLRELLQRPDLQSRHKRPATESGSNGQAANKQPRTSSSSRDSDSPDELPGTGTRVPERGPRVPPGTRPRIVFHRQA